MIFSTYKVFCICFKGFKFSHFLAFIKPQQAALNQMADIEFQLKSVFSKVTANGCI